MKILIIGFAKIKYMPYLNLYLDFLNREKNDIHLIYWNRDLKSEDISKLDGITLHEFYRYQEDDVNKLSKIASFIEFRKFAEKILEEKFDFIITLHSLCSVILSETLIEEYKNRYIFDYRDYTYENVPAFKKKIDLLIKNSYKTFISSDAFKEYLPNEDKKFLTSCNFTESKFCGNSNKRPSGQPIRIGYWGFIRDKKTNLKIIEKLGNDNRFELHYYGREQGVAFELKDYVKKNSIKNIFFHGEYNPEEKSGFACETDIIHNIFEDKAMRYAVSNRFYDAIIFKKPLLSYEHSYMGRLSVEKGLGLAVNPESKDFADEICNYYENLDFSEFVKLCEEEKLRVIEKTDKMTDVIKNI